ncbi:MAG: sensor histidine kinase [Limnochordaceae bacterium]|nr:sensor histidine kinase [Limnochordaceae bacterium]
MAVYINLRWLVLAGLALFLVAIVSTYPWVLSFFPAADLAGLVTAGLVANAAYTAWQRRRSRLRELAVVQLLLDAAALTWLVYLTGGIESPLTFGYGMIILSAGILLGRRQSYVAALFSFGAFLVPLVLEGAGVIPSIHSADLFRHFGPNRRAVGQLVAGALLNLFLVGGFAGLSAYLVGAFDERQRRLLQVEQDRERLHRDFAQKVVRAQEEERSRIARQLHDQTGQLLSVLIMRLEMWEKRLNKVAGSQGEAGSASREQEQVTLLRQLAEQTLDGIHQIGFDLRPSLLDDLGLAAAIRAFCEASAAPVGVQSSVTQSPDWPRLPTETETAIYRIVQEAVLNVIRHAQASRLWVDLARARDDPAALRVEVIDNGCGFDLSRVWPARRAGTAALGLLGMEERARLLGGGLQVASSPGNGCRITVTFPAPRDLPGEDDGDE